MVRLAGEHERKRLKNQQKVRKILSVRVELSTLQTQHITKRIQLYRVIESDTVYVILSPIFLKNKNSVLKI